MVHCGAILSRVSKRFWQYYQYLSTRYSTLANSNSPVDMTTSVGLGYVHTTLTVWTAKQSVVTTVNHHCTDKQPIHAVCVC